MYIQPFKHGSGLTRKLMLNGSIYTVFYICTYCVFTCIGTAVFAHVIYSVKAGTTMFCFVFVLFFPEENTGNHHSYFTCNTFLTC